MHKLLAHRYYEAVRLLKEGKRSHSDKKIKWLIDYLRDDQKGVPHIYTPLNRAVEIFMRNKQSKIVMEAGLMARNATVERIAEFMKVEKETITDYEHLFFDTSVFKDRYDIIDYMSDLREHGTPADYATKSDALRYGWYTICDGLESGEHSVTPEDMLRNVAQMSDRFVRQAQGAIITSRVAKEAKTWAGLAINAAIANDKYDDKRRGDAFKEFPKILLDLKSDVKDIKEIEHDIVK